MKDHVDALIYNLGSRESETPTRIFYLALPPQSSLVKEKMLASKSTVPFQDFRTITAKDVEMNAILGYAILDHVMSIALPAWFLARCMSPCGTTTFNICCPHIYSGTVLGLSA